MKKKYLILFSLCGLILSLDQLSKHLVREKLEPDARVAVAEPFLSLHYTTNNGFAFGLLQRVPKSLQEIFFIGIPIFALILIVLIFIKLQDNQFTTSLALTTILGGAIGNMVDRVQYGHVIDFLDIHWMDRLHLPPFNVADCSIIIGVVIMFLNTLATTPGRNQAAS